MVNKILKFIRFFASLICCYLCRIIIIKRNWAHTTHGGGSKHFMTALLCVVTHGCRHTNITNMDTGYCLVNIN